MIARGIARIIEAAAEARYRAREATAEARDIIATAIEAWRI